MDKESPTANNDSLGMVTGGRVIHLVLYGRIPLDDSHKICMFATRLLNETLLKWGLGIHNQATFGDIERGLSKLDPNGSFSVLQPVWGPIPRWVWADSESHIESICRTLYAIKCQAPRHVVATVRTRLSDYPVIVCR